MEVTVLLRPTFGSDMPSVLLYGTVWGEAAQARQYQDKRTFGTDLLVGYYTIPVVLHTVLVFNP